MTKDVLISITGNQSTDGENHKVEMITAGVYYEKNGSRYILYDEQLEGAGGVIKNTVKVRPQGLDIIKSGATLVHMIFEEHKKNTSRYATTIGELMVGFYTNSIDIEEGEDSLRVQIGYSLDINYEHVSECRLVMDVQSKATADIHLQ